MKGLLVFCVVLLVLGGVLPAKIPPQEDKTKAEEDIYGDLSEGGGFLKDQNDYYETDDLEEAPEETRGVDNVDVKLISKPETFVQELGTVVRLPCLTSSKDEPVRMWSKDSTLIFQGGISLTNKNNYRLINGTLEVLLETDEDFGTFTCQLAISDESKPEVIHKIVQKTVPSITTLYTSNNQTVFNVGEQLTLVCQASGQPKPKISWFKHNERLGTDGELLTITVDPRSAGQYRCLADNQVGRPDHKFIDINVNHAPIVTIEKYLVNSDHKSDAELVCEVKAYPSPGVNWQRDGLNIVSKPPKITLKKERNGERNILIIKNVSEDDFGEYSCTATNGLGRQEAKINLVKTPVVRKLEKSHSNESSKDIILEWRVESKQPISKHELQYRRKGETEWRTITPEVGTSENDVYLIKQTLTNLEPGIYETRARSRNSHGWSNYSDIIPFLGVPAKHASHHSKSKHTKKEQKDNKIQTDSSLHDTPAQHVSQEATSVGESTSSCTKLTSSIGLLLVALLSINIRQ